MRLSCPICEGQPLQHFSAEGFEAERCPRCAGTWLEVRKLAALPGGSSVKPFLRMAQHLPGRCRRAGHPIPRGLVKCPTCSSSPAKCPTCGSALARVPSSCAVDICVNCQGIWLDAGELEVLKQGPSLGGWEIPEPSPPAVDPWLGPGQSEPVVGGGQSVNPAAPFSCRHCLKSLRLAEIWALNGDVYCGSCHPPGAVSSHELPATNELVPWSNEEPASRDGGFHLFELLGNLARRI